MCRSNTPSGWFFRSERPLAGRTEELAISNLALFSAKETCHFVLAIGSSSRGFSIHPCIGPNEMSNDHRMFDAFLLLHRNFRTPSVFNGLHSQAGRSTSSILSKVAVELRAHTGVYDAAYAGSGATLFI